LTSPRKIRVSPRALTQIEEAAEWWARNRPSAPNAIRHDVAELLDVLCTQPGIGAPARRSRAKGVRRVTLARVRYYIYYRV
jgi:plasmid stabilization system protein ParE